MSDSDSKMLEVLEEMRDLLRLLAEPAIAERDKKLRDTLRTIVGAAGGKNAKAVFLMDGSRTQAMIVSECGIAKGQLSPLAKALREASLLVGDPKFPRLAVTVPAGFFEKQS